MGIMGKKEITKQSAKVTLAEVIAEMAKARVASSAQEHLEKSIFLNPVGISFRLVYCTVRGPTAPQDVRPQPRIAGYLVIDKQIPTQLMAGEIRPLFLISNFFGCSGPSLLPLDLCPSRPLRSRDLAPSRCRIGSFAGLRNWYNFLSVDFRPPCFLSSCDAGAPFGRNFAARTGSVAGAIDSSEGLKCRVQS